MASVYPRSRNEILFGARNPSSLARGMSRHTAGSLLLFTLVQIAAVVLLADRPGGRILPFVALAVLMLAALPFSRMVDQRWARIADAALPSHGLATRYRRDRDRLWWFASIVPVGWIALFSVVAQAAAR